MLVIILGLYGVVYKPVTYLMADKTQVQAIAQNLSEIHANGEYVDETGDGEMWMAKLNEQIAAGRVDELSLAQAMAGNVEKLKAYNPTAYDGLFEIHFGFLGLDLGDQPSYNPINLLAILPVISAITAYLMSLLTQKLNAASVQGSAAASAANTSKMMLYFMPIMSLVIGFTLPAGLTLYWIVNNILSGVQEPLLMYVAKKRYGAVEPAPVKEKKKPKPVVETTGEEVTPSEESAEDSAEEDASGDEKTSDGDEEDEDDDE